MNSDAERLLARMKKLNAQRRGTDAVEANPLPIPNIIEFVTSPDYLNLPGLFPRQATVLKIATLQVDLLTDFDRRVIAEWEIGFRPTDVEGRLELVGDEGCAPGTIERMVATRAQGREWFREIVLVLGRRASKSYLTAILAAYALYHLVAMKSPQRHFKVPETKQLLTMTVATKRDQALRDLHYDLTEVILKYAPCFQPFIGREGRDFRLRTPADLKRRPGDPGSLLVQAQATNASSGRGPAAPIFLFDEMAHAAPDGQTRSADEVYNASAPAQAQFPHFSLIVMASSPASQTGEFYRAFCRCMEIDERGPVIPDVFALQLPSWALYKDWDRAHTLEMWRGGPKFEAQSGPLIADNSPTVEAAARYNRPMYEVEYLARWASSQFSFFRAEDVRAMFAPVQGERLAMQHSGQPHVSYVMHVDPSRRRANYGIAIGHLEGTRRDGRIKYDLLKHFPPSMFDNGEINTVFMLDYIWGLIEVFKPRIVSFDQYDSHVAIDLLQAKVLAAGLTGRVTILERTQTAFTNRDDAERFNELLVERRVHAPTHAQTMQELLFLEDRNGKIDHPATGPVVTSDLADCVMAVAAQLLNTAEEIFNLLAHTQLTAGPARGLRPPAFDAFYDRRRNNRAYNPARGDRRPGGRGTHGR